MRFIKYRIERAFTSSSNDGTCLYSNDTIGGGFTTSLPVPVIKLDTSLITGLTDMGKPYRITIVCMFVTALPER